MSMQWERSMTGSLALTFALSLPVLAQTTPPAALPAVSAAVCPASFYAAGVSLNPQATPNLAGWYAIALPITKCEKAFQAYSITMNNLTPKGSGANLTFTSTTSTGLAIPLKQVNERKRTVFEPGGNMGRDRRGADWQDKLASYSLGSVYRWKMDRRFGYRKELLRVCRK
jgi:hypothetical protein